MTEEESGDKEEGKHGEDEEAVGEEGKKAVVGVERSAATSHRHSYELFSSSSCQSIG